MEQLIIILGFHHLEDAPYAVLSLGHERLWWRDEIFLLLTDVVGCFSTTKIRHLGRIRKG